MDNWWVCLWVHGFQCRSWDNLHRAQEVATQRRKQSLYDGLLYPYGILAMAKLFYAKCLFRKQTSALKLAVKYK